MAGTPARSPAASSAPAAARRDAMYKLVGAILVAALVADFIWVIRTALSVAH